MPVVNEFFYLFVISETKIIILDVEFIFSLIIIPRSSNVELYAQTENQSIGKDA